MSKEQDYKAVSAHLTANLIRAILVAEDFTQAIRQLQEQVGHSIEEKTMLDIKDYWRLPASDMQSALDDIREIESQKAMEAEAVEKRMLIHKGELIRPEDYPCVCELACPSQCYEERENISKAWLPQEKEAEQCFCPCHTWYEPF